MIVLGTRLPLLVVELALLAQLRGVDRLLEGIFELLPEIVSGGLEHVKDETALNEPHRRASDMLEVAQG